MVMTNLGAHPDAVDMAKTKRRHIRSNVRDRLLARALNEPVDIDCTAGGTITLTLDQMWASGHLRLIGTPGGAFTLELADGNRDFSIENTTGQTATIETATGATSPPVLLDGETFEVVEHGTDITVVGTNGVQAGAMMADGSVSPTALINLADNTVARPKFKDISQVVTSPSSSSGALTLDMENGNVFDVTLTEDVTTLNLDNPPDKGDTLLLEDGSGGVLLEDGSGILLKETDQFGTIILVARQNGTGGWEFTWPVNVLWEQDTGGSPAQTLSANAVDIYAIMTLIAGVEWYGIVLGLNMK
ncbi:hypothetical protein LCGC14_1523260 [marine sediment metagenome]|uniref:Uncharacterized protein n=1 Tax=marine sediment metagenome TaxID=412755 RepID=A0A0F9LDK4_9ZZZZ